MTRLELNDELTIVTAADTVQRLRPYLAGGAELELDLSGVTDIDTAGLQLLLVARREAERLGTSVTLADPSDVVRNLLEFTRLTGELEN
ncbi:STAS domain-containing protein [Cryptosporangium aurantiacum]|uniref:Anti-anti-sigma factor n=1 Tax=Cryptosporangium aurantiacum TaxID=134849 RepID=A0A1M7RGK3_9ACTN|nr:STAS domain-containing protein [Cryptosporangium aurantiacum]SHN45360.1 anti-anti-sigma factor [Cryptosporangium aurantiacum]